MNLIEKLTSLAPEHQERIALLENETQLDSFLEETGAVLTPEEKETAIAYLHAKKDEPCVISAKQGSQELADEELDNVAGGHGGACHDKNGREIITLVNPCVHELKYKSPLGGYEKLWCGVAGGEYKNPNNAQCKYVSYEKGIWYCNYPQHLKK